MAHEIEGTSLLYAGDIPWHRIGTQVTPEQSSDVEYLRAHPVLNWTADLEPLYTRDGIPATGPRYQTREEVSAARNRLVRDGQDLVGAEQVRVVEVRS